jgi:predicted signal transduction protein with EAL and GGDEF domain
MSVTCSFGVAEWQPGEDIDQLLKRADVALYQAKNGGRNCVVTAEPADHQGDETQWSGLLRSGARGAPAEQETAQPLSPQ